MPAYTHRCEDCGKRFEIIRDFSQANDKPRCPKCKSRNTKKIITPAVVIYGDDDFTKHRKKSD